MLRGSPARTGVFLVLSLALGFAGLYLVAGAELFWVETYRVENVGAGIIAVCVAAFFAEWLMPPVRLLLLCKNQRVSMSYGTALLVHLVSVFGAVVTPGNAGQAPAAAAAIKSTGAPFGKSLGVVLQVFVLDLFFFAWAVPLSLLFLISTRTVALPGSIEAAALLLSALALAGAVALGRYPRPVMAALHALAKPQPLRRFDSRLRRIARDYGRSVRLYRGTPLARRLALNTVTAVHWLAAFVLLWGLLEIYGADVGLGVTLALLNILTLVSQVVPTPGGAGFVEAAVGLSLGTYATGGSVAAALLVWRLLAFNIIFLIGPLAGWLLYLRADGPGRRAGERGRPGGRSAAGP